MGSYRRELVLDLPERQSAFLWGPRKTGKSTLLAERFPDSARFDLLERAPSSTSRAEPWLFTERVLALDARSRPRPIVVDLESPTMPIRSMHADVSLSAT